MLMRMKVSARIKGNKELIQKNNQLIRLLESGVTVEELLAKTVADIKRDSPEKEGDLKRSVRWKKVGDNFKIYVADFKASFFEYGTRYIKIGSVAAPKRYISTSGKPATRPFIRPSMWRNMREYPKIFHQALFKIYKGR